MRDWANAALISSAVTILSGCFVPEGRHTIRFDLVAEPTGAVVHETHSYFFWGLVPTVRIDVLEKCPHGAVAIIDGAPASRIWFPTLGLWKERSTTYYCRQPRTTEGTS